MKIIDLLNKIANGEDVPKKIKLGNIVWYFDNKEKTYLMNNSNISLFYVENITKKLNDEIEIIEENNNKIERWEQFEIDKMLDKVSDENTGMYLEIIMEEQNKIIDKLNEME